MDAEPYLRQLAEQFAALRLEAVLIGNPAAALQGAPVTTMVYPVADMYGLMRDLDHLQIDFPGGSQPLEALRSGATAASFGTASIMVARKQLEILRIAQIEHALSIPPERRTNSLRVKAGVVASAL